MYKNILVPIAADHDPSTEGVLEVARALAADGGQDHHVDRDRGDAGLCLGAFAGRAVGKDLA